MLSWQSSNGWGFIPGDRWRGTHVPCQGGRDQEGAQERPARKEWRHGGHHSHNQLPQRQMVGQRREQQVWVQPSTVGSTRVAVITFAVWPSVRLYHTCSGSWVHLSATLFMNKHRHLQPGSVKTGLQWQIWENNIAAFLISELLPRVIFGIIILYASYCRWLYFSYECGTQHKGDAGARQEG